MKRALIVFAAIALLPALLPVSNALADPALEAYWPFDEGSGSLAGDRTGHAHNGALEGSVAWIPGFRSGGIRVSPGGRVAVPNSSALEPATVTVSAYVRRQGSPGIWRYILGKGASACMASSYALYSGPAGGLMFYISGAGANYIQSPDAGTGVWDGQWHHVIGTYDGARVRLFVDGAEVGTGTDATTPISYTTLDSSSLLMGTYAGCASMFDYDGDIDEAKVFTRALAPADFKLASGYDFAGFFAPVDNQPHVNLVKAGSAVPVKFSLTGYQGMSVFDAGYPSSSKVACESGVTEDPLEQTVATATTPLIYDATSDRYQYVWKTEKSWANTCRQLTLRFADGSVRTAAFRLK
jgi:concanavalin A-like lectin/glucanase superfamily protein